MTTTVPPTTTTTRSRNRSRHRSWSRFVLHYLEMVIAMALGMALLHPVAMWVLDAVGRPELMTIPETGALIMGTTMAVAMVVPMRLRRHRWRHVLEMSATMYLPFVVLFVPMWLGWITAPQMFEWGHLLMLPAMAGVMLARRDEYARC